MSKCVFQTTALIVLFSILYPTSIFSQKKDSQRHKREKTLSITLDKISSSRLIGMTYIGAPLIIGGVAIKSEDRHFRSLRNDYMPEFRRHLDDFLQFSPAAVMLGLKIGGVESHSSWGRMLVSDAFSAVLMGFVVNTLKNTTKVDRPDGSNNHSFPSGHTATAFMTATMLNREYGDKYPFIGIGGYALATTTGLMRMANNKHWLSDVLTGAGIGILSTEVGYYLADMIFKGKGLNTTTDYNSFNRYDNPSFIGLYLGMNLPLSNYDVDDSNVFSTSSGSTAGIEGAYFLNPYFGLGGRFDVSNTSIIVNGIKAEENTFDAIKLYAGCYLSYPLSSRWLIGTKFLVGPVYYPELKLSEQNVSGRSGIGFGNGLSLTLKAKSKFGMRLFFDYNLQPSHSRGSREYMNMLVVGSSMIVNL